MINNKLSVFWDKGKEDIAVKYPLGIDTKSDGMFFLYDIFTDKIIEDIKARGYDLKTLKLSINIDINNPNIKERFPTYYLVNTLKNKLKLNYIYENLNTIYFYTKYFGIQLSKIDDDCYSIKCVEILCFKNWEIDNLIYNKEFQLENLKLVIYDLKKLFKKDSSKNTTLPYLYIKKFQRSIIEEENKKEVI